MAEDLETRSTEEADVCLLVVDFDAARLGEARRAVSQQLDVAGLATDQAEDFLVAVSEAMTNAVRHGAGNGRIRLWRDGRVVCEVADDGTGFAAGSPRDRLEVPSAVGRGGRGLWLAQELADSMSIDSGPDGTSVRLSKILPAGDADPSDRPA